MAKDYGADLLIQQSGNTGWSDNGILMGKITGMILMPKSLLIAASDFASTAALVTYFNTASTAVLASRVYPFLGPNSIADLTDNTAETALEESGYGLLMGTTQKKRSLTIRTANNGQNLNQKLFKFNGNKGLSTVLYDALGNLYFEKSGASLKGAGCQLVVDQTKLPTGGSNAATQNLKVIFDDENVYMNADRFFVFPLGSAFLSLNRLSDVMHGIHDIKLKLITATASAITVEALRADDLRNMGDADMYANQLAAAGGWSLILDSTGAAVTVTGVTVNTLKQFVLVGTFTTAAHTLQNVTAAALKVLTVGTATTGGYESNSIAVTPA